VLSDNSGTAAPRSTRPSRTPAEAAATTVSACRLLRKLIKLQRWQTEPGMPDKNKHQSTWEDKL
jgi:hypothetical protein